MAAKPPRCRKCRRPLRDEASLARKFGPHCWRIVRRHPRHLPVFPPLSAYRTGQIPGQTEIPINDRTRP